MRVIAALIVGVLCSIPATQLRADNIPVQDKPKKEEPRSQGRLSGVGSLVDDTHTRFSNSFNNFVVQVDDFIASSESDEQINNSSARIRIDTVQPGGEGLKLGATLKLRVVLPQAQQRFRLLLSSGDDDSSADTSDAAQREQVEFTESNDVAFAFRFIRRAQSALRLKYDVGARFKDDRAQLFGRIIAGYKLEDYFGLDHSFSNNFSLFSSSGYSNNFRIDSRRNFFHKEHLFFRNTLELSWRKGLSGAGIGETFGIYADLGRRRALALESITGYSTSLNPGVTDRFLGTEIRFRYRQSVWRPWFYYEVWPSVSWSSSNDFEPALGGLFRIEVTFGKI